MASDAGKRNVADRLALMLREEPGVTAAWLFGSESTGRAVAGSDVDVGILTAQPFDWEQLSALSGRLEDAAGGRAVDVVDVRAADPILAFEAVSGRLLFKHDPALVAEAVSLVAREYESAMELIKRGMQYRAELAGDR
jgi:predicted nucleotidyltransferase